MFWLPGAPDSADRPGFCSERLLGLYIEKDESGRERDGQLGQMGERKTGQFGQGGTPWMVTCPSSVGGRQRARHVTVHASSLSFILF